MVLPKGEDDRSVADAFLRCRDALMRSVMKLAVKREDADDILQEAFVRTLKASGKSKISSPQDYLFIVARNLVYRSQTRHSREILAGIGALEIEDASEKLEEGGETAETDLYEKRKYSVFKDALEKLPGKQRQAIILRKYYDLSYKEIAARMHVSVSSVEKYVASGIELCAEALIERGYSLESNANDTGSRQRQGVNKENVNPTEKKSSEKKE